jgi:hypothetical protein
MERSLATSDEWRPREPSGMTYADLAIAVLGISLILVPAATPVDLRAPNFWWRDCLTWSWVFRTSATLEGTLDSLCVVLLLVSLRRKLRYGTPLLAVDVLLGLGATDFVTRRDVKSLSPALSGTFLLCITGALALLLFRLTDPGRGRGRRLTLASTEVLLITALVWRVSDLGIRQAAHWVPLGWILHTFASSLTWTVPLSLAALELCRRHRKPSWLVGTGVSLATAIIILRLCHAVSCLPIFDFPPGLSITTVVDWTTFLIALLVSPVIAGHFFESLPPGGSEGKA